MTEYFRLLSAEEVKSFGKFVNSPYFNSYTTIIKLFDYLKSKHPDINGSDITKINIHKAVYGRSKYTDTRVRKLLSAFTSVFENFLLQERLKRDSLYNSVMLAKMHREKKMNRLNSKKLALIYDEQAKVFDKDHDYYYNQIEIEEEYLYLVHQDSDKLINTLVKKSEYIDSFFLFQNLFCYLQLILFSRSDAENTLKSEMKFYDVIMNYTEENIEGLKKHHPNIVILFLAVKMFLTKNDKYFEEAINYFQSNSRKFRGQSSFLFHLFISAYLLKKKIPDIEEYHKVQMQKYRIFKLMFGRAGSFSEYYRDGRYFDHNVYIDIIELLVYLGEAKLMQEFVADYFRYLEPERSDDARSYTLAAQHIVSGNFEKVYYPANQVTNSFLNYFLGSKFLICRAFYELKDFKALKSALKNLSNYSRGSTRLPEIKKTLITTYIKHITQIMILHGLKTVNIEKEVRKFRAALNNEKNSLHDKYWFYKKADEISQHL